MTALNPNPIDLTTVAAVKSWLGNTGNLSDDQLQRTVTNVSRFVLSWISRGILPANYSERYDGYGGPHNRIMLQNWPVLSITQASIGNSIVAGAPIPGPGSTLGSGWLLSPGDDFPPGSQQWLDFQGWGLPRGSQNIGIAYRAGYASSETLTIPADPFQFVPTQLMGRWSSDEGVKIGGLPAVRVAQSPTTQQYAISFNGGDPTYQFAGSDLGRTAILSYGYVPQDVEQAALEMIAYRFKARDFIGLVSKTLGGQETITFSQKDMSDAIGSMLNNYKRVF